MSDDRLIIERVRCLCGSVVFRVDRAEKWLRLTCCKCDRSDILQGQTYRADDDIPF